MAAYWASLACSINADLPLQRICGSFAPFAEQAHAILLTQLTQHVILTEKAEKFFPVSQPLAVLTPSDFYNQVLSEKIRLQKSLAELVHESQRHKLWNALRDQPWWATSSDVTEIFSLDARPTHSLALDLSRTNNRWSNAEFISFARMALLLPQLPHLSEAPVAVKGLDHLVEICCNDTHCAERELRHEDKILDLHGAHARSNCPPCKAGTHFAHGEMKHALQTHGAVAGLVNTNEPTHTAMLASSGPARTAQLFPKHSSVKRADLSCELITKLFLAETLPLGERAAAHGEVERDWLALGGQSSGLRLDCCLMDPAVEIAPLLVDVATAHLFAKKNLIAELGLARGRSDSLLKTPLEPIPHDLRSCPTLDAATARKKLRYRPLLHAINEEMKAGIRHGPHPVFTALVVSTSGHITGLGPVKKVLTAGYLRRLAQLGPRHDGVSPEALLAKLLGELRSDIIVAAQRGLAKSMLASGRQAAGLA